MPVSLSFIVDQSADGATLTFTDTSVYTAPDVIGDYTRRFVLNDSTGETLDTLELGSELVTDYAITKDLWLDVTLEASGSTNYTETVSYFFFRNTANKLIEANAEGCCTSKFAKENLTEALRFIKGAEFAGISGNKTAFQTNIDAANLYLDQVV